MLRRKVAEPRSARSSSIPKSTANGTLLSASLILATSASPSMPLSATVAFSGIRGLDNNCCAVRQHLGDSGGDLGRVITGSDYRIGADLRCMLDHDVKSVRERLFTKPGPHGDVTADDGLQVRADRGKDIARADNNAADHAQVLHDAIIRQLECRCHHLM